METNDTQEIEVNDELRGMLSGNFDDTSPVVVEDQEDAPVVENKDTEDAGDQVVSNLPEHRFVRGLWGQVFVITAQVTSDVFVPVVVFLLPDKMRISFTQRPSHSSEKHWRIVD